MQHQLTSGKRLRSRLSMVRILPLAAVHKKKDNLLGAFVLQMHFQGKEIEEEPSGSASNLQ